MPNLLTSVQDPENIGKRGLPAEGRVIVFQYEDEEREPAGSMHWSEKALFRRDLCRIAAMINPVLVKITPTATMTVTATTRDVIVSKAAAIADTLLRRINVHFDFAVSGLTPIGSHHEALLEKPIELEIPGRVKEAIFMSKAAFLPSSLILSFKAFASLVKIAHFTLPGSKSAQANTIPTNRRRCVFIPDNLTFVDLYLPQVQTDCL